MQQIVFPLLVGRGQLVEIVLDVSLLLRKASSVIKFAETIVAEERYMRGAIYAFFIMTAMYLCSLFQQRLLQLYLLNMLGVETSRNVEYMIRKNINCFI